MKRIGMFLSLATILSLGSVAKAEASFASASDPVSVSSASYCVYYWCTGEWHTYATYATRCAAGQASLNLQAQGYQTKIVSHY